MNVNGKPFRILLAALTVGWGPMLCCCGPWGGLTHAAGTGAGHGAVEGAVAGESGMAGGHCGDAGGGSGCHGERSAQPEPDEGRASLNGAGLSGAGHDDCDCHVSAEAEEERPVYTAAPSRAVEAPAVVDFRTPVLRFDPEWAARRWSGPSSGDVLPDACLTDSLVQQHTLLTT